MRPFEAGRVISMGVPEDFSFRETLSAHGWRRLLPFAWVEDTQTLERVERLDDGSVVGLAIREDGPDALAVWVSSEGVDEGEVTGRVRRMLQLDLPVGAFHAFCREHPKLCGVPEKKQGRLLVSPTVWEDCVKVICTTNTTWTQTIAMTGRIVGAFGSPWPDDPARRAFPTPAQVAAVSAEEFAAAAKLGYRNAAVHELAIAITAGQVDLEALRDPKQDTAALWKRLLALRGVGPYAASCLMIYLGRYGRVNVDSWARTLVGKELGRVVGDRDVHEFFAPFGEWQALAYHFFPWQEEAA